MSRRRLDSPGVLQPPYAKLQRTPTEPHTDFRDAPRRVDVRGIQNHMQRRTQVFQFVELQGPPRIGARACTALILTRRRQRGDVRAVVGIGEFIVIGFRNPGIGDAATFEKTEFAVREIALEVSFEQPVVARLVLRGKL